MKYNIPKNINKNNPIPVVSENENVMMKKITQLSIVLTFVAQLIAFTSGAQIAAWNFNGVSSPATLSASSSDPNLTVGTLTRGAGAAASAASNSFRTVGFKNDGISTANTDYFQFTLTANSGYTMSLTSITAAFGGTTSYFATPGVTSQYAYSIDGSTFTLIGSPSITTSTTPPAVTLSSTTTLQNVPSATTVYIRYYASGQTTSGGWGFSNTTGNGLAIAGTLTPVACSGTPNQGTITAGASTICTGTTTTLTLGSASSGGGISYKWQQSPDGSTWSDVSTGSGFTTITYTTPALTATTYYRCQTTCSNSATTVTSTNSPSVTVVPNPSSGTITGGSAVCVGSNLTLSTTGYPGGTWAPTTGSVATVNSSTGVVRGVGAGSRIVTYTAPFTCGSATTTLSVTVNAIPTAGSIVPGTPGVQVGTSITLTNPTSSAGTAVWSTVAGTGSVTITSGGVATGLTQGTATISYGITSAAGCGPTYTTRTININGTAPTISSFTPKSGIPGSTVVISGTNFNATPSNNIVYFGATKATVNAGASTTLSLSVTVPAGALYAPISVTIPTGYTAYTDTAFTPIFANSGFRTDSIFFNNALILTAGGTPYSGAIGDLNGDGKPDLAVNNTATIAGSGTPSISIFKNIMTGTGVISGSSFSLSSTLTSGISTFTPNNVKIADIDGDGKLDLVVALPDAAYILVYLNTTSSIGANPTFASATTIAAAAYTSVAAVRDFDGDGKPDIALSGLLGSNAITVLPNTSSLGAISFGTAVYVPAGAAPSSVCIADLDHDGLPDVATVNSGYTGSSYTGNSITVARNTSTYGNISFGTSVTLSAGSGPIDVAAGDINNDGKNDLLVTNINAGTIGIFINTSTPGTITSGSFAAPVSVASGSGTSSAPTGIAVADMDGDGKLDVVVSNNTDNTISVFKNLATGSTVTLSLAPGQIYATGSKPVTVTIGDLDGDGYPDVVTGNRGTSAATANTITILKNYPKPPIGTTSGTTNVCPGSSVTLSNTVTDGGWALSNTTRATISSGGVLTGIATGADTVIYYTYFGSDTSYVYTPVTINPLPSPLLSGTSTISSGASTTLTFTGTSGDVVYYWNGGSTLNTTIGGSGISTVSVSPTVTTTYSVTSATSALGCSQTIYGVSVTITINTVADTTPTRDDNMAMGNPSSATTATTDSNNYLMVKSQYGLSYNNSKGEPNWVSWHLSRAWKGSAVRCDCFSSDTTLPSGYFTATTTNYSGTGFDRGHLCPSDDRDASDTDNAATFKMTNMTPQAPNMNQITWGSLESYCRSLIYSGNELYIIAGGYGAGGSGSSGGTTTTIAGTSITVPNRFFKVIVVLPVGVNDVSRVANTTRVIAVDMPNAQSVNAHPWTYYRTSVDAIEAATGYDFLSNVPTAIQAVIEAGIDNGPSNVLAWDFNAGNSDTTIVAAATSIGNNLDTTSTYNKLSRGATATASTGASSFRTQGFQNNGISTSNTDYFETKIKAATGYQLSLSSIDATFAGTASFCASPGVSSQFAYSLDGTTYTLIGSPTINIGTPSVMTSVNLTGISALQNVSSTTPIYLRYYASGQTTSGGWGFFSQYVGNYGLSIDGTTQLEPCTTAPTSVTATLSSSAVCSGTAISLTGVATTVGATVYSWSGPNGYSSTDLSPAAFTTGTASAGVYTLVAANSCGSTTATTGALTINVAPTAVSATPSSTNICSGSSLTLTGAATSPIAATYAWTGPNGFSSTLLIPSAITTNTNSAGVYTLVASNACGSTTATSTAVTITVGSPTVAAIAGSTTLVAGTQITLTNTTPSGTWASTNTAIATVNASGVVTGVSAGADTITYALTNVCGTTASSYSITVTPAPVTIAAWDFNGVTTAIATQAATVFNSGLSTASSANNITRGAGAVANAANNSFRTTGFQNNGIATSNTDYFQVTLGATPGNTLSLATIDARFAGTATFANSPGVSNQFAYSLDGSTFNLIGSPQVLVGTPSTLAQINLSGISALQNVASGTTVTIRYYASGQTTSGGWGFTSASAGAYGLAIGGIIAGCTSAPTAVSATSSATTLCTGSPLTLTGAATGAVSYSWAGPNGFTSTLLNPAAITTGTASAGVYTLVATNSCGSTTATTSTITINTAPTAVSATPSATSLCSGNALTLTGAATGATSYSWTGPNGFSSTLLNPASITVGTASAGIYTLVAANTCGSTSATTTITINVPPTSVTANAPATACDGTSLTITGTATGATSYSWSGPNGFTSTILNPAAITVSIASAGIYSLTATNTCGNTTAITVAVAVITAPTSVSATASATTLCTGTVLTLTGVATNATTYSWSGPNSYTSTSLNPAAITTDTASAGVYTLVASNSCGSTTATTAAITINNTPTAVSATPSATTLCAGAALTLTGAATNATTYSWSGPNGFTSTDQNPAPITVGTASAGIYTLVATNSCGNTSATTTSITINVGPTAVIANAPATVCTGASLTLTGTATGATSYSWSGPNSFSSTDLNPAAITASALSAGIYTLTATNFCSSTTATSAAVTIITTPTGLSANTSASTLCSGSTLTLTAAATGATSYAWSGPNSFSSTDLNPAVITTGTASAGSYTFSATNSCGTSTTTTSPVSINPLPTPTIAGTATVLIGGSTSLTFTGITGDVVYYSWTGGSHTTTTIGASGTNTVTVSPTTTTTYTIDSATSATGCFNTITGQSAVITIDLGCTVAPTSVTATLSTASVCTGNNVTLTGAATNATSYSWSGPNSYSSTDLNPATFITSTLSAGVYTLTATNACGSTTATTTALTVNTVPTGVTATPSPATVCNGATLTLTGTATGATTYSWSGPNGYTSTDLSPAAITVTTLSAGIYSLTATNSCGNTVATTTSVTVTGSPTVAAISGSTSVVAGSNLTLTDATPSGTWVSANTSVATVSATGTVHGIAAGSTLISYTVANSCSSTTATLTVTVSAPIVTLAAWDFNGVTTAIATQAATVFNSGLSTASSANNITRGAGAAANAANNSFRTVGFQNNGIATSNTDYFQVTLGATAGNNLSLATIDARFAGTASFANSPGVSNQFAYSLDGSTFTLIGSPQVLVGTPSTLTQINLSGISALQNVASGTTVTIRYYASGQTSTGGWGFTSASAGAYGLAIAGSITSCTSAPTAVAATPSATNLCTGSALTLTGTAAGATTYSWTGPNSFTSSLLNPAAITTGTASAGVYTLIASNSCGSTTATTAAITINNTPTAVSATPSATSLCTGATLTLSGTATGATTYSWTGPNSFSSSLLNPAAITTSTASTGIYTLVAANSCGSTTATTTSVSVNTGPTAVTANAPATVCTGTALTVTGTATGATSYSWSGPDGFSSTALNPAAITASAASAGIYTLVATSSCGSTTATSTAVAVINTPTGLSANASATTLCSGSILTFTGAATGATSYSWSGPNSFSSTALNPAAITTGTASAGIYTLTATNSCGSATTTTAPISINPLPTPTIAGTATVLIGGSTTLTFTGVTGDVVYYSWTGGSNANTTIGASGTNTITVSPASTTTYTIDSAFSAVGCFNAITGQSAVITIDMGCTVPPTSVSANLSAATVCTGNNLTLTGAATNATAYAWSGPNGFTSTLLNPATFTTSTLSAGVYTLTATNACGTTTVTTTALTVSTAPTAVSATPSATTVCNGTTLTLTGAATGATTYSWSGPNGYTSTDLSPAAITVTTLSAGIYSLTASNTCGNTIATTASVTVTGSPTVAAIAASATSVTIGSTVSLTDATATGIWSSSNTAIATVSGSGIVTGIAAGVATISYSVSNSCATTSATQSIIVTPTPVILVGWDVHSMPGGTNDFGTSPLSPTTTAANVTVPQALTRGAGISTTGSGAARGWGGLDWQNGTAATAVTGNDYASFTMKANSGYAVNLSSCTIAYRRSSTGPGSGELQYSIDGTNFSTAMVLSYPTTSSGGNTISGINLSSIPALQNVPSTTTITFRVVNYSASASGGTWYFFDVANTTAEDFFVQGSVVCAGTPAAGTVAVTGASTFCGSGSTSLTFTPGAAATGTAYQWNSGNSTAATSFAPVSGATSGSYTTPTLTGTTYYNVSTTCAYSGLSAISGNATVTVNPLPVTPGAIIGATTVCAGSNITLTDTTTGGVWSSTTPTVATIDATGTVYALTAGTTTISYVVSTPSCGSAYATTTITVNPLPSAGTITGPASVCLGTSSPFATTATGGSWSSSNLAVATVDGSGTVFGVSSGNTIISYTNTNSCGTAYDTMMIAVNTSASAGVISGTTSICPGTSSSLADGIAGGTWSSLNTSVATINNTSGVVTGVSSDTVTIVYTVSTSCGTAMATTLITVNPILSAPPAITGTMSICLGATTSLANTTAGGAWSSSDTAIASINSSGVVSGVASGSVVITYTITNLCGSAYSTTPFTVNPLPAVGAITGSATVCNGSTTSLSDTTSGGVWSSASPAIASINASTGVVSGLALGNATISYAVTNSCGTTTTTRNISVISLPAVSPISGATVVYNGASVTLTDTASGGTWTSANTAIVTIGATGVATGLSLGTTTITYTVVNGCGTTAVTAPLSVLTPVTAATATWNFTAGSGASSPAASSSSANVLAANCIATIGNVNGTVTAISSTSPSTTLSGYSGGNNIGNAAFTGAISATSSYIQFTITPNSGYFLNISGMSFAYRGTGTGPQAYTVKSSVDGYSAAIATGSLTNSSSWLTATPSFTSSIVGGSSTSVTVRVYGHAGTGSGTANTINWRMDDVNINFTANQNICTGTPAAGTSAITGTATACGSGTTSLTFTPGVNALGTTYQWAQSNDAAGTFTPIAGATSAVYITPTLTDTTYYVTTTTCNYSGLSANTTVNAVVINPAPSIALSAAMPTVCQPTTSAPVSFSGSAGSPTSYSIDWDATANSAGFSDVTGAALVGTTIPIVMPATGAVGTFNGSLTVTNGTCTSAPYPVSTSIMAYPTATVTSLDVPCLGHAGTVYVSGTPSDAISYMVDSGTVINTTLSAGGTLTISTGIISTPHNYTIVSVANAVCTTYVDTTVYITPTPMQWIGGSAGHTTDWNYAANWGCNAVPAISDNVTIDSGAYIPEITVTTPLDVQSLTLGQGASLVLNSGSVLNVKGNITNNGTVSGAGRIVMNNSVPQSIKGRGTMSNLELANNAGAAVDSGAHLLITSTLYITNGALATSDSLELASSDTVNTARIAPLPTSSSIVGKVKVDQYVQGHYRRYRFWSHPFDASMSLSQLQRYMDITGQGGAANGFTPTGSNAPSAYRLDPYNENDTLGYDPGWRPFTKINALAADSNKLKRYQGIRLFFRGSKGEGLGYLGYYGMYVPSPALIKMFGNVNQGPQTAFMAQGSAYPSHQSFNMMGNPYPSPVDIGTVIYHAAQTGNVQGAAFYVWDPTIGASGNFITIPIGTSAPIPYNIGANTCFQVRTGHDGDSLNFVESDKTALPNNYLFKMPSDYLTLNIYDSSYHLWDALHIQFNDKATSAEDNKFDAVKQLNSDFTFYSISAEHRKLAIDARPFETERVIPLGIGSAYAQNYIIRADNVAVPAGSTVFLHDKLLDRTTELKAGTEYAFTISKDKSTQGDERFELSMKPATNATDNGLHVAMTPNPASDDVNITFTTSKNEPTSVRVTDISGVNVYSKDLGVRQGGTVSVSLSNLAAGIYMVELTSGDKKVVNRLVKE